jgi:hypothetical protein
VRLVRGRVGVDRLLEFLLQLGQPVGLRVVLVPQVQRRPLARPAQERLPVALGDAIKTLVLPLRRLSDGCGRRK